MSDVVTFTLAGVIIAMCGKDSAGRGVGWCMAFIGFVIMVATRVLEVVLGVG
jgi:hypothetical protein